MTFCILHFLHLQVHLLSRFSFHWSTQWWLFQVLPSWGHLVFTFTLQTWHTVHLQSQKCSHFPFRFLFQSFDTTKNVVYQGNCTTSTFTSGNVIPMTTDLLLQLTVTTTSNQLPNFTLGYFFHSTQEHTTLRISTQGFKKSHSVFSTNWQPKYGNLAFS